MAKRIIAVISKDGDITFDFNGFIGKACLNEARKLEEQLKDQGVKVNIRELTKKREFYVTDKSSLQDRG